MKQYFIIVFFAILPTLYLTAQSKPQPQYTTKNKKAISYFNEAQTFTVRKLYPEAIEYLTAALKKDDEFIEAYTLLGTIYKITKNYAKAKINLQKAIDLQPNNENLNTNYFIIGDLLIKEGKYQEAKPFLQKFLTFKTSKPPYTFQAERLINNCEFAEEAMKNPVDFKPKIMDNKVNSFPDQYFPSITADGKTLIYTSLRSFSQNDDENLVVSTLGENGWSSPVSISPNINSLNNEGTASISGDGKTIVFTSCGRKDSKGTCDLYISYKKGNDWSVPTNMGEPINTREWESQPSLSADGRTLYFVSSRRNGFGKTDIFVSNLDEQDKWSMPKNLGPKINTPEDDVAPFIHANGKSLYFSSNGRPGMGGMDIYVSLKQDTGFTVPTNIGYPLNTSNDEQGLIISTDYQKGYYSGEAINQGKTNNLIFEFDIPKSLQNIQKTNIVKGTIFDPVTKQKLEARIELIDLKTNKLVTVVNSDPINGDYTLVLNEGSEYALYCSKKGYLFKSLSFNYTDPQKFDPVALDIQLDAAVSGSHITLNNIFFESGKFELQEKSKTELDKLVLFLKNNSLVKVEISGHTDDIGKHDDNMKLSSLRAKSVADYLIQNSIDPAMIKHIGYGETVPNHPNDSEEHRQLNRRIEFKIL